MGASTEVSDGTGSLSQLSDLQLLEGIRSSSEPHFSVLYARYFQRLYRFVHARIRNHADAEEIVQETFLSVFRSIDSYRGQASLLSWMFGIAKNLVNSAVRRSQNQQLKLGSVEPTQLGPRPSMASCSPEEQLHMRRYAEVIERELGSLAEWQSQVFRMRHLENLSIPEIAERTDRSNDAIRSSLYRIKRMMLHAAELGGGRSAE